MINIKFFMPDIINLIANKLYWKNIDKKEVLVCAYCQEKIDIPKYTRSFFVMDS